LIYFQGKHLPEVEGGMAVKFPIGGYGGTSFIEGGNANIQKVM
jgi:hypothetical protein